MLSKKNLYVSVLAFFLLLLTTHSSFSNEEIWMHGLAMHDKPALKEGFTHFPYVHEEAQKGGSFRQAMVGSFDSLNPNIVKGKAAAGSGYLLGRLMARSWDEPFTLYPWIAEKVAWDKERSWVKFKIDKRAKFSDGQPLTAEDVLFSFETLKKKGRPNFRNVYSLVKEARLIDDYTIEFTFTEQANRETAMIMGLMPVYAKHYWQDKEFEQTILEDYVSSGAYKVQSVDAGRQVVYERIKDYWAADIPALKGHYNFDELVYDYYRDANVLQESFKSGAFDLMREQDPNKWKTNYNYDAVEDGTFVKYSVPHQRPEEVKSLIFNTRKEIFKERKVRLALRTVFDFDWINKTLFNYSYNEINSIFPNSRLAAERPLKQEEKRSVRQNLKRADQLLKEMGYIVKNGIRVDSETAIPFTFEILLQDPSQEKVVLSYVQSLKKLGIDVSVRTVDSAQFFARLNDFDFDMVLFKWHSTLSPGNEQAFYWGSKFADIKGSRNYPAIKDPEIDSIIHLLTQARTRKELIEQAHALDKKIMQGIYFIPLYYDGYDRIIHHKDLRYGDYTPLYGPILETWWRKL